MNPLAVLAEQRGVEGGLSEGGVTERQSPSILSPPKPTQSPPKHALFSTNVDFFEPVEKEKREEEEEEEEDEDHFRHRRLTGDSGIEVCRCQVKSEEEDVEKKVEEYQVGGGDGEEGADFLHDSVDCSLRAQQVAQCGHASSAIPRGGDAIITVESS